MGGVKRVTRCSPVLVLLSLGCSVPKPVEGVWRPAPGEDAERIPGPMKNFGPFDTYADALKAACPLILSKPHAAVGHLLETAPDLARRTATEYCAWLYYTPEHKYEMSMLTDQSRMDDVVTGRKSCVLPTMVDDSRYAASELKYIFALHNHPFGLFSKSKDPSVPSCDGFYQFTPATNTLMLWTQTQGRWMYKSLNPSIHLGDR